MSGGSRMFPDWLLSGLDPAAAGSGQVVDIFPQSEPEPLPERLTLQVLRQAITAVLAGSVKAYNLAEECVHFGLGPPASADDDPGRSKRIYVEARVRYKTLPELITLAGNVAAEYDDRVLDHLLSLATAGGVRGEMKNLIFAPLGVKPKIVLRDAINNDLELTDNTGDCLVYNRPLGEEGLTWRELVAWRAGSDSLAEGEELTAGRELYTRLSKSAANGAERFILNRYSARYQALGFDIPALIPQVYLHYDPYTRRSGGTMVRQRMDFLLLLPRRRRVVIELDGVQHYADDNEKADPGRYAEMVAADRELKLSGYEVYRFGGKELAERSHATGLLDDFFSRLLDSPS